MASSADPQPQLILTRRWTPLVLPVVLKVGDVTGLFGRESVIPTQLDRKKDKRLDVLLSRRRKNE